MNINTQDINMDMDNLHEMFMAMHMSENGSSPLQIPSATSPFGNTNFVNNSPTNNNTNQSPTSATVPQQTQQQTVNNIVDVEMGEKSLTAYEEQMLFLEMQDQLYQQIEEERLRIQQM